MKHTVAFASLLALTSTAPAALNFTAPYSGSVYHTHSNADAIVAFAWGSDDKNHYATSTSSFSSGGLFRIDGAASTQIVAPNSSLFSGASVVAIGSDVFFNDSNLSSQFIRRYDIGSGSVTSTTVTNYALGTDGTNLYTTGSGSSGFTDLRYYANGNLGSAAVNFGAVAGASGPVAFDSSGNLFYAPGFGDLSIYRWNSSEVMAAIAGGSALAAAGHTFATYSLQFPTVAGASALAVDAAGSLFVTLTSFSTDSSLVRFDASGATNELVATSGGRLGGLDFRDGQLYVADGNQIYSVIPEPSALMLSLLAVSSLAARRRR